VQKLTASEWSVQEFTYLSPASYRATTSNDRLPLVEAYWRNAVAEQVDRPGAESFLQFLERVQSALTQLGRREQTILVVSHEMFIKAAIWLQTRRDASRVPQSFRAFAVSFAIPNLGRYSYDGTSFSGDRLPKFCCHFVVR
jgi:probable phosphoglycerate mutase